MAYYPPPGFHFNVDFSSVSSEANDNRFQSVTGLSVEMTTEEYKEGGENRFVHVLPVKAKYPKLVLKRGMLTDSDVIKWCLDTINNLQVDPIQMWIDLLDEEHNILKTWSITHAWPVKWDVSEFNAENSSLVIETLELSYHFFNLE